MNIQTEDPVRTRRKTAFAIAGMGNVGTQLVRAVLADQEDDLEIAAIATRRIDAAKSRTKSLGLDVPVVTARELPRYARIVVECATYDAFREVVEPALVSSCHVICVSVGALASNSDLIEVASRNGATLQIASGAMPGLDILRCAREGGLVSVSLESQILPSSLAGEPYVAERGIDVSRAANGPLLIFSGTAREAATHFPRHFNVAVALALAGAGYEKTNVEIFANGLIKGTVHKVSVKSPSISLDMTASNFPSEENPRTSRIVAPSILAALREINSPVRIGS
ncbi:MAG: DUF108 domain-containing protein [Albidovulum sp.]|nr:DUF108 domain-containing protein [Albidovulum sp.]